MSLSIIMCAASFLAGAMGWGYISSQVAKRKTAKVVKQLEIEHRNELEQIKGFYQKKMEALAAIEVKRRNASAGVREACTLEEVLREMARITD